MKPHELPDESQEVIDGHGFISFFEGANSVTGDKIREKTRQSGA
jgi:hypothetical protein